MQKFMLVLLLFFLVPLHAGAQDQLLAVDLAENHVDITTGFNGARLTLFGVQEEEGDIAIVITGPRRPMVVRRKEKVAGIWMNKRGVKFNNVPVFYDYALAVLPEDLARPEILKEQGIGMESLQFEPDTERLSGGQLAAFQKGLLRNKQEKGLFPSQPRQIVFLSDHFFRTSFYIPAHVKTGSYEIKTYLFQDGAIKDIKITDVTVAQVGVSAGIYSFAHKWSLAYGVLCVLFAMSVAWLSDYFRRRHVG